MRIYQGPVCDLMKHLDCLTGEKNTRPNQPNTHKTHSKLRPEQEKKINIFSSCSVKTSSMLHILKLKCILRMNTQIFLFEDFIIFVWYVIRQDSFQPTLCTVFCITVSVFGPHTWNEAGIYPNSMQNVKDLKIIPRSVYVWLNFAWCVEHHSSPSVCSVHSSSQQMLWSIRLTEMHGVPVWYMHMYAFSLWSVKFANRP